MDDYVIAWDLETVPDLAAVARIHGLPTTETEIIREVLGEKFPKHLFHSIVCIGWCTSCSVDGCPHGSTRQAMKSCGDGCRSMVLADSQNSVGTDQHCEYLTIVVRIVQKHADCA
jgi:hypothetical protein